MPAPTVSGIPLRAKLRGICDISGILVRSAHLVHWDSQDCLLAVHIDTLILYRVNYSIFNSYRVIMIQDDNIIAIDPYVSSLELEYTFVTSDEAVITDIVWFQHGAWLVSCCCSSMLDSLINHGDRSEYSIGSLTSSIYEYGAFLTHSTFAFTGKLKSEQIPI